jgi:hypothetical protein
VQSFDDPLRELAQTVTVAPSSPVPEYVVATPGPKCVPFDGVATVGAPGAIVSRTNTAALGSDSPAGNPFGPVCETEIV